MNKSHEIMEVESSFIAVGANRHPSAADWDSSSGLLAFGADRNIAIWSPLASESTGIQALLSGHTDTVNAVKFCNFSGSESAVLLSGSVDKSIRVWTIKGPHPERSTTRATVPGHEGSINAFGVLDGTIGIFASGSSDGCVKVWRLEQGGDESITLFLLQTISLVPRFFPLSLALHRVTDAPSPFILAVGGTKSIVQIYASDVNDVQEVSSQLRLQATLTGHEGWVRSLEFIQEDASSRTSDILLASASQDKYIRLWRFHAGEVLSSGVSTGSESALNGNGNPLSNKAHIVQTANSRHLATFEALLLGHEDWIYTLKWRSRNGHLRLLSSSADNSLAIWEPDRDTGVWVCTTRLGEISGQMGATTATGSAGGFWIGLWSPDGNSVVSLGKNGGWRLWTLDAALEQWIQRVAVSGHTKAVMDTAWTAGGEYLLSTSSDQTTRLFAEWKREGLESWHEFSRPQIHGYDLNCIDTMGEHRFVSGADEKLLRVFEEPRAVETLLHRLCEISAPHRDNQLETANMPVLGLSNRAVAAAQTATSGTDADEVHRSQEVVISKAHQSLLDLQHPPFEDHLSRQTLWPETEKLYGHGYEISAVACSHDGHLVATACRASSIDHAVIRLFETSGWTEIKPPLSAHSLTVTALSFTQDDQFLLSVGRDRMWAVFEQDPNSTRTYKIVSSNPKGHSRMILGASWAPVELGRVFATAGRDKLVKIWKSTGSSSELEFVVKESISAASAVSALSFSPEAEENVIRLAFGTDLGVIQVCSISLNELSIISSRAIQQSLTPSRSINRLAWRPGGRRSYYNGGYVNGKKPVNRTLAAASDDNSLRIYRICILED